MVKVWCVLTEGSVQLSDKYDEIWRHTSELSRLTVNHISSSQALEIQCAPHHRTEQLTADPLKSSATYYHSNSKFDG